MPLPVIISLHIQLEHPVKCAFDLLPTWNGTDYKVNNQVHNDNNWHNMKSIV